MFLLDTNVLSELRRPRPHGAVLAWLERRPADHLHVSAVTIGEIQAGIELLRPQDPAKAAEIERWLDLLETAYEVLPVTGRIFRTWAKRRQLRPDGALEDGLIAATAEVHGLTVVTRNVRDFEPLGVATIDPFKATP